MKRSDFLKSLLGLSALGVAGIPKLPASTEELEPIFENKCDIPELIIGDWKSEIYSMTFTSQIREPIDISHLGVDSPIKLLQPPEIILTFQIADQFIRFFQNRKVKVNLPDEWAMCSLEFHGTLRRFDQRISNEKFDYEIEIAVDSQITMTT